MIWFHKTELMFKLFPGLPGHLRQLLIHFGSGRDAYFIVAMAVPVLEFALLFVIDFPCIVCYFFQEILVCKKILLQKNPFPVTFATVGYVCHISDIFIITEFFTKIIWHWILIQILQGQACPPTHQGGVENCSKVYWI